MAQTEAQRRASLKYVRKNVTQKAVKFYPADADLLEWLESRPGSQNAYIKDLIRADMEEHGGAAEGGLSSQLSS